MKMDSVLLVYKRSAYELYFLNKKSVFYRKQNLLSSRELVQLRSAHEQHYKTLGLVEWVIGGLGLPCRKISRGQRIVAGPRDLVVTVGGDGTFLEAARSVHDQVIFGVNSDPRHSVGRFCAADAGTFSQTLGKVLSGNSKLQSFHRLQVNLKLKNQSLQQVNVLNDVLICHQNPAATSRYQLTVNGIREEQRSSGVWISTAVGSSGGIRSAGGKLLPKNSHKAQYKPRELYRGFNPKYRLKGGAFLIKRPIEVDSLMSGGVIFVDGAHLKYRFVFGDRVSVVDSNCPLRAVLS